MGVGLGVGRKPVGGERTKHWYAKLRSCVPSRDNGMRHAVLKCTEELGELSVFHTGVSRINGYFELMS